MSITLSLATSAERAAALAALTVYINHLDGDTRTLPLPFEDRPDVGVVTPPVQTEVTVIPSASAAFRSSTKGLYQSCTYCHSRSISTPSN